ncbi:hypothetical protein [Streptomyces sp. NPDC094032]|uniref:hypothetical protein n=1 Tax=Streptomyces sp. NPDC094032 TaxID=3155308 RepID=UPI00331AA877
MLFSAVGVAGTAATAQAADPGWDAPIVNSADPGWDAPVITSVDPTPPQRVNDPGWD